MRSLFVDQNTNVWPAYEPQATAEQVRTDLLFTSVMLTVQYTEQYGNVASRFGWKRGLTQRLSAATVLSFGNRIYNRRTYPSHAIAEHYNA